MADRIGWLAAFGAALLVANLLQAGALRAADHHVDPAASVQGADGSAARPWPSPAAAFASGAVSGDDTLLLATGNYGDVVLSRVGFDTPVTLRAAPGAEPRFYSLHLDQARNLVIDGIDIWGAAEPTSRRDLVRETGSGNTMRDLDIRSTPDATDYLSWRLEDWQTRARSGIWTSGRGAVVEGNRLAGVGMGIAILGDDARVSGNTVRGFAGDAIRGVGDFGVFRDNLVADCVTIDSNHDDGFQSWSRGPQGRPGRGVVRGLVLEANTILEWTGPEDHPLRCDLQGIGLFDGFYEDLTIANNLVVVSAYHGISVYGGRGVRVVNNTLVYSRGIARDRPWILVADHGDGTPSEDIVVANNLAPRYMFGDGVRERSTFSGNHVVIYPHRDLDFGPGPELRPRPGSALRGQADLAYLPPTDRSGRPHPAGGPADPGAFAGD